MAREIVFHPLHPDTGARYTREEPNLHLEFYLRVVTVGMRSSWNLLVEKVSKSSQEVIAITKKNENTVQPAIGLGFH